MDSGPLAVSSTSPAAAPENATDLHGAQQAASSSLQQQDDPTQQDDRYQKSLQPALPRGGRGGAAPPPGSSARSSGRGSQKVPSARNNVATNLGAVKTNHTQVMQKFGIPNVNMTKVHSLTQPLAGLKLPIAPPAPEMPGSAVGSVSRPVQH